ncbi:MAG: DJ-1/PfpI family protein [Spirochaetia bacterium]|jgi:4-methyl-5(b-hydroxyethyl)-thiazole monophosphate biosynthesis|nr:DJ-1/PfpI family protein [Spirochaetia bacterium]
MKRIVVLLAEGFEEVEAATPIDFLRRAGLEVITAGVSGKTVTGAHGVPFTADVLLKDVPAELEGVVIPGGMPGAANIAKSAVAVELVKRLSAAGKLVAAICAAPGVVLGPNGFLKGKRFTCYPGFEKDVSGASFSEERVVVDGNLVTSRGPGTAAEFALTIVGHLAGREAADRIHKDTLQE